MSYPALAGSQGGGSRRRTINPHYKRDKSVSDLVREGMLHPSCNVVFADWELRRHRVQSVHISRERHSFVVTTGTGSGKSIWFFLPIIDAVLRARATDQRKPTRAIVVYPMNALANKYASEIRRLVNRRELGRTCG